MSSTVCKKEILLDILARLPAKTLIRFLSACKSWSDVITSPDFIATNINTNLTKRKNVHYLCLQFTDPKPDEANPDDPNAEEDKDEVDPNTAEDKEDEFQWSFLQHDTYEQTSVISHHPSGGKHQFKIYGSSNGLICVSDEELACKSPIYIWNPLIKKVKMVPMSSNNKFRYLALQFGFHPGANDYKVVRTIRLSKDAFAIEVYSLNSDSWKMINDIPPWLKCHFEILDGIFLKGVTYRLLEKHNLFTMMAFDSDSQEFEEFVLPEAICSSYTLQIRSFEGKVCLFLQWISAEEGMDRAEFWVLQENKRWKTMTPFHYPLEGYSLLEVSSIDNEMIMEKRNWDANRYRAEAILVNYETREARETGIKRLAMPRNESPFVTTYVESLALLN